ncbi:hypothetical protein [Nocardia carnea]|uniref:hypothetical protein n=1 Tax=Nocardia carnea TaxID=37328 RepID=UPI002458CD5C|nr:hypothetical protein [Nocardia carnea]
MNALSNVVAPLGLALLSVLPLTYILSLTAVFARKQERRDAARRVLALLWRNHTDLGGDPIPKGPTLSEVEPGPK